MSQDRPPNGKKVVLAMSGGVDSSVAAVLLKQQGYDVVGCFMRLGTPEGVEGGEETETPCTTDFNADAVQSAVQRAAPSRASGGTSTLSLSIAGEVSTSTAGGRAAKQGCCSVLDSADARRVANLLDIPFYVLNFQEDFGRVIDYFVEEYNRGRTPNPCVRCNDWLKFGRLAQYADAVGAEYVASGHYARVGVDPTNGQRVLMRGLDEKKDQSYVLFGLPAGQIDHMLLPIGGMEKHEVRAMAERMNLPVFNKPDSQEICFVPDGDYAGLVRRRSSQVPLPGELVTADGTVIGRHDGHQQFTIGQRKGVGLAMGRPVYVTGIDADANRVTVGEKEDLLSSTLKARQINIVSDRLKVRPGQPVRCTAKIRYNHLPQPAVVCQSGDDELTVTFDQPQSAITPGQAVVCYNGDVLLCGGWIESAVQQRGS